MHTPFTLCINILHVQMICNTDLYDCVISYTVIISYVLYAFDMLHIMSGDSVRDLWDVFMYSISLWALSANKHLLASSCPSIRLYQRGCHWTNYREIRFWGLS